MPVQSPPALLALWERSRGFLFPLLIVVSVLVIVTPLPALLLDGLLACNVTIAVIILLTTVYVQKPLEFSVFPALLLGTTLARLVLNVASTRLILTKGGSEGVAAAGGVIESFGSFVAGNNLIVGLIIFVILVVIQFLVITKGATRIGEVTARFTLDAMPAKQMAIDADLAGDLITPDEAKARRKEIAAEADFYGSMDGASKFVRGDAVAGIVITLINIAGGLYVGVFQNGRSVTEALSVFTTLTIGDGLVTQIPAFLISLAAGLIVTRSSAEEHLPEQVISQLFRHAEALFLATGFLFCLALTGLPLIPLLTLAVACSLIGYSLKKNQQQAAEQAEIDATPKPQPKPPVKPQDHLLVDALELEMGEGLILMAEDGRAGDLDARIKGARLQIAQELGMLMPDVRIRDNRLVPTHAYHIRLRGVRVASGTLQPDMLFAVDLTGVAQKIPGLDAVDPAYGRPAKWITPDLKGQAEKFGYRVIEATHVLTTHLTNVVREHAAELLSREQVHTLVEHLKGTAPKVVDELIPGRMQVSKLHQVLTHLLDEQIPIKDLESILETLGDFVSRTEDPILLTECVRNSIARTICDRFSDRQGILRVIALDPAWEEVISQSIVELPDGGSLLKLPPDLKDRFVAEARTQMTLAATRTPTPVLVTAPALRPRVRQMIRRELPKLAVMSLSEITRETELEVIGQVQAPQVGAA